MSFSSVDFSTFTPANHLWQRMVEKLGLEKAQCAIRQAFDLQSMHGNSGTLPLLIFETCGLALVSIESLRYVIGLTLTDESTVLLISTQEYSLQLLKQVY